MSDKITYITAEGLSKLKAELGFLKTAKRKEIAERIHEAKELGDLSENAEYTEAKEEQAFVEGRILQLEDTIKNVQVIKLGGRHSDHADIGSLITAKAQNGKEMNYRIVGSSEADPTKGFISNESPIGKAFIGKRKGEIVAVVTPRGKVEFQILHVA